MVKFIFQITKFIISLILFLLTVSCVNQTNFSIETIKGNGNVVTQKRSISQSFDEVESKTGIKVVLEQSTNQEITVKTDENLQSILKTEIKNGVLSIYFDKNNIDAEEKTVFVKMPNISKIRASSGSSIESSTSIKSEELELKTSSGSEMNVVLNVVVLNCESSSGSEITARGKAKYVLSKSSSGSSIDLKSVETQTANCKSSSGSSTKINPIEKLDADASSGGSIKYYTNTKEVIVEESSGGSVQNKNQNISQ